MSISRIRRTRRYTRRFFRSLEERVPVEYLLVGPAILTLLIVVGLPILGVIFLSFTEFNVASTGIPELVGFENFAESVLFNDQFYNAVFVTAKFVVGAVALQFGLGFAIALLLWGQPAHRRVFLPILLAPMFITWIAVGLVFRFLFDPQLGIVPLLLGYVGLGGIPWLSDPTFALLSVVIADVWQWTPFLTVLILAGLESLPAEPHQAARIDFTPTLESFQLVVGESRLLLYLFNTFVVASTTTLLSLFVGGLVAYSIARFDTGGRKLYIGVLLPVMIPPITLAVPLFFMFNYVGLVNTRPAIVVAQLSFGIPFAVWFLTDFFRQLSVALVGEGGREARRCAPRSRPKRGRSSSRSYRLRAPRRRRRFHVIGNSKLSHCPTRRPRRLRASIAIGKRGPGRRSVGRRATTPSDRSATRTAVPPAGRCSARARTRRGGRLDGGRSRSRPPLRRRSIRSWGGILPLRLNS